MQAGGRASFKSTPNIRHGWRKVHTQTFLNICIVVAGRRKCNQILLSYEITLTTKRFSLCTFVTDYYETFLTPLAGSLSD